MFTDLQTILFVPNQENEWMLKSTEGGGRPAMASLEPLSGTWSPCGHGEALSIPGCRLYDPGEALLLAFEGRVCPSGCLPLRHKTHTLQNVERGVENALRGVPALIDPRGRGRFLFLDSNSTIIWEGPT